MIEEVLPELFHWSAFHEVIGHTVRGTFALGGGNTGRRGALLRGELLVQESLAELG